MGISTSPPANGWDATAAVVRAGPAAGMAYGGFWIRALAFIIDSVVVGLITAALLPLTNTGAFFELVQVAPNYYNVNLDYGANAFGGLIGLLYFTGFWATRGQTPGMMPFRLRVVRADNGGRVDVVRSLLRYVGLLVSFAAILIGVVWAAFDSRKQGWHDKVGETVVVRPA
jgi:uncharacterized RDD family membrane protein YckC